VFAKRQLINQTIIIIGIILFSSNSFSYDTSKRIPKDIQIMIKRGEYKEAFLKMLRLRKKEPTIDLVYEMAKTLEKMQNFSLALFYYQDLATNATSRELISIAKKKIRQYYKLYTEEDVVQERSQTADHLEKGLVALKDKDFHKATIYFLRGRKKQTNNYLLHFWLAFAYHKIYNEMNTDSVYLDAAIKSYQDSLKFHQSPKALNNLACIFGERGDKVMAFMYFQKAIIATKEVSRLPGLRKTIESNLDFFTNRDSDGQYKYLKEINTFSSD
jgi:Flp pilus assembly protein TadD